MDWSGTAIILISALTWTAARIINNEILFKWTEVADYRHWVFVPAGIKLVLVMLFGWRGALGVMLGLSIYLPHTLPILALPQVLLLAVSLAFAPLVAVHIFSRWTGLVRPWLGLEGYHLPGLVLLSAVLCALPFHGMLLAFGVEHWEDSASQMSIMVIGDFLGAGILMLLVVGGRALWRLTARNGDRG